MKARRLALAGILVVRGVLGHLVDLAKPNGALRMLCAITDPLIAQVVGLNLPTQPSAAGVETELNDLLDTLIGGPGDTIAIMKGTCAATLGSAAMLVQ